MAAGAVGFLRTPLTMEAAASISAYPGLFFNAEKSHRRRASTVAMTAEPRVRSKATCCCGGQSEDFTRVYEELRVIGKGATSTVYLVRRLSDSKLLALKEIPLYLFSPREKTMTVNEIAIMQVRNNFNLIYGLARHHAVPLSMELAQQLGGFKRWSQPELINNALH